MDWNSDGVRDLIAGDRYGYLNVFIQTDSGLVAHYKVLKQSGDTFDVGYGCAPTVMDWNADGKKDLIAGREAALTYLYINVGSDSWPIFQDSVIMSAGGSWIVFGRGQPTAFDIDQDGRKDVIYGEIGGSVHCFRNIGPDSNPQLVRADTLKTVDGRLIKPSGVANTSKCGFGDWNNDGTPDFLISGQEGMVDLYLGATQSGVEDTPSLTFQPSSLRIEPNPATGGFANLRIQGVGYSSNPAADVRVFDVLGQCVLARPLDHLTTGPLPLDLRGLRAGVYLVRLTAGETCAGAKLVVR